MLLLTVLFYPLWTPHKIVYRPTDEAGEDNNKNPHYPVFILCRFVGGTINDHPYPEDGPQNRDREEDQVE